MSGFSIPGAVLPEAEEIRSYDGRSMQDWLSPTDEKLSFIMEGGGAKGIVIATDTEPILAGGEKSGPELFALYEKIKETGRYFFRAPGAHAARSARGRATDSSGSRRQNRGVKFMNKSIRIHGGQRRLLSFLFWTKNALRSGAIRLRKGKTQWSGRRN
ncbi:hypothetical protein D478_18656 [Brevibacillus agri BAB-2500]|nr:hypothetical protein D478_18656 [Brevibacillus agri BAB-2500]